MSLIAADQGSSLNGPSTICVRVGSRKEGFRVKPDRLKAVQMQPRETDYYTDGLPKAFLHSLRTLFDILDDGGKGFVHISEIESRWQGAGTQDLPGGVLESLRRAVPPHGCLTFERFVSGLRYSMLNPENTPLVTHPRPTQPHSGHHLPRSKPALTSSCVENKVRPLGSSNVANTQRRPSALKNRGRHADGGGGYNAYGPPRYNGGVERTGRSLDRVSTAAERSCCRSDTGRVTKQTAPQQRSGRTIESLSLESPQLLRPRVVEPGLPRSQSESATGFTVGSRRHGRTREEQRRHTITNGVDYGMLKQMKELEQEKDSLLAGLELVDRARDWYQEQIHNVTERQRQVGQGSPFTDFFSDASQSRMDVVLPKLQEVTRCLNDLISCTGMQCFPSTGALPTVTLPTSAQAPATAPLQAIHRLKDQNRLLTQEVTEKSERITQLEQEKSALIKQLFEARSRSAQDTSVMDSTFI